MRNPFSLDLVLLHAPSVFDFRERAMLQGPVADVIPSTDEFEMYPVGLTSLAAYLERNSYNVRIVNLAYRMLSDAHFDPERYVTRLTSRVFGIDLHWLPHANGALALAKLIKRVHPDAQVLMGALLDVLPRGTDPLSLRRPCVARRFDGRAVPPTAPRLAKRCVTRHGGEPHVEAR